jgi:2-phospho-L-lactate guanylyltransferase
VPDTPTPAVLVPVKAFHLAKRRLSPRLAPAARAELSRRMGTRVLAAARPLPTLVVCEDAAVAAWAEAEGAQVLWTPGLGLNGAVTVGVGELAHRGFDRVIVAHADLPHAQHLQWLGELDGITLVPDRRNDGTNVCVVPSSCGFRFTYGPGSFRRHAAEAQRLGTPARVIEDADLAWDVDVPADLPVGILGVAE